MYSNHRGLESRWLALAMLWLPSSASAHDADVIYVLLTDAASGALEEVVTLTAGTLTQLAPVDADGDGSLSQADLDARADAIKAGVWDQMPLEGCTRSAERAILRDGFVELIARFACPSGPRSQEFRILSVLTSNYRVVQGLQLDGASGQYFAQGHGQRLLISPRPSTGDRGTPGFASGLSALFEAPGVILLWLWALLWAGTLGAAGLRTLAVLVPAALVSGVVAAAGWRLGPTLVPVGCSLGLAFAALSAQARRLAAGGLVLLSAVHGFELPGGAWFQLGRACGILALMLIAVPLLRIVSRRPALKRRVALGLICAAIFSFGFSGVSLILSARAF